MDMLPSEKKEMLHIAIGCLRQKGQKKEHYSKKVPTEKELREIKKGLHTGKVNDTLLEKLFPKAYKGVKKNGVFSYYLQLHNSMKNISVKGHGKELMDWCTVWPGTVIGKSKSKFLVKTCTGKIKECTTKPYPGIRLHDEIAPGTRVLTHRDIISLILDVDEHYEAVQLFEK